MIRIEVMSVEQATQEASRVMRELGRKQFSDRELSILARELRQKYHSGRLSMWRTIAKELGMTLIGDSV